jgi:D-serine deaminase-like pyridoxal phosphate-dependent protein
MDPRYRIDDAGQIITPALIIFSEILEENIARMVQIAGDPSRLRPHCKTHKMREVAELQLRRGITKHKCATFAEAEMLAGAGAKDVFLAYNLVGPNIRRAVRFVQRYPDVAFSVIADHVAPAAQLGREMAAAGGSIDVLLDLDTGQHRTGVQIGRAAKELYGRIAETAGLNPGGLHVYDGQNHQTPVDERKAAVDAVWEAVARFRDDLLAESWPVPRIVAGGTGSFPMFAAKGDPTLELSPGTCVFYDAGYAQMFPDLDFTPAALILTRVISRPTEDRVTLDLGYKACASDPPAGSRLVFPELPDAKEVLQNEEHLVIETAQARRFEPGDELLAISRHACPTSALHKQVFVVSDGACTANWEVVARDRWLTI